MNNKSLFDFIVNKEEHTILVRREFDAKLSLVWMAWTTSELLDQWWAPEGYISRTKSMTFEIGGRRHYSMQAPDGAIHWGITTYEEIEHHQFFRGQECFANEHEEITTEVALSSYHIQFEDLEYRTIIQHVTTFDSMDDLEKSLSYGFEEGTIGAYKRLDDLLIQK